MLDFPAAHSMDTYWFAIDADENVAIFASGEAGAVPTDLGESDETPITFIEYLPKDDREIIHLKTDGETLARGATLERIRNIDSYQVGSVAYEILLVLSSEEVIDKLRYENAFILRFAGEMVVVYVNRCPVLIIEDLIKSREILGGKYVDIESSSHLLGLFSYSHGNQWENWIAGPYIRGEQPEKPLKFKELPGEIQNRINLTLFQQIRFRDTKMIQPIEYTECDTWEEDGWVDMQGKIHEDFPDR